MFACCCCDVFGSVYGAVGLRTPYGSWLSSPMWVLVTELSCHAWGPFSDWAILLGLYSIFNEILVFFCFKYQFERIIIATSLVLCVLLKRFDFFSVQFCFSPVCQINAVLNKCALSDKFVN